MTKILLHIFIFTTLISSKDRYQVPSNYLFEFEDSTLIELRDDQKSNLVEIDSQITKGQKKLKVAILKFKTGEVLELRQKNNQWKQINVTYKDRTVKISKSVLKKSD
ncbi:MAG: hypothetical protein M0D53_01720 [Flavobacterium sp. JAD_PAG50586_2]|nr:MAG: hypothetical protein M0D53_01720 [Flavobacterium sp. JAD_PAG50586_2]